MDISTKYNPGDILWTIDDNKLTSFKVTGITIDTQAVSETHNAMTIKYWGDILEDGHTEYECFPSKGELLQSLFK